MNIDSLRTAVQVFDETKFSDIKILGYGGEGTVLKATYKHYGNVAFKKHNLSPEDSNLNKREINTLLRHSFHPNIIRLLGFAESITGQVRRITGIVMELMENGSLHDVVHNLDINYEMGSICSWMIQAGRALCYLHNENVVHRDIKPKNLLLCDNYRKLKVADFGITRTMTDSTILTAGVGSLHYIPPEVVDSEAGKQTYSSKIDIYSFAITIWETIVRKKPYHHLESLSYNVLLSRILKKERPLLIEVNDEKVEGFLERAWSHDPSKRPIMDDVVDFFQKYGLGVGTDIEREISVSDSAMQTNRSGSSELLIEDMEIISPENTLDVVSAAPKNKITKRLAPDDDKMPETLLLERFNRLHSLMEKHIESISAHFDEDHQLLRRIERIRRQFEPAVRKLKKRFLSENERYSLPIRTHLEIRLFAVEEQLQEFRVTLSSSSEYTIDMLISLFFIKSGSDEAFGKNDLSELKKLSEYYAKLAKEVVLYISKEDEAKITLWMLLPTLAEYFNQFWNWGKWVDCFINRLKTEVLDLNSIDDSFQENYQTLQWPQKRDKLAECIEEIKQWKPYAMPNDWDRWTDLMKKFAYLTKNYPERRKAQAVERFNRLIRQNDFYYKLIMDKVGKPYRQALPTRAEEEMEARNRIDFSAKFPLPEDEDDDTDDGIDNYNYIEDDNEWDKLFDDPDQTESLYS